MVTGAHVGCRLRMRRSSVYDDDIMQYLVPCLWEESGDETKPPLALELSNVSTTANSVAVFHVVVHNKQ